MSFRNISHSSLEVHVTRGPLTESIHFVDAVVLDSDGNLLESYGPIKELMYPRSAIKMMQALAYLESGVDQKLSLTDQQVAISCASHYGDLKHIEVVQNWLQKIGFGEDHLICGSHYPIDEEAKNALVCAHKKPGRIHNNCSGKHTGMLSFLWQLKLSPSHYGNWDHPLQVQLRKILSELTGLDHNKTPWGVDGCGIPTYAMTLESLARGLTAFLRPEKQNSERAYAIQRIKKSIAQEPHYIAGKDAFCTDVISTSQGRALVKVGAEGIYAAILSEKGVVFALKAKDGAFRACEVATGYLLKKWGGLSDSEFNSLSKHTMPTLKNWAGQEVGKVVVLPPSVN